MRTSADEGCTGCTNYLTSVDRGEEAPVARPHGAVVAPPARAPLDAVAVRLALARGPEAEVEGGDEEEPVHRGEGARVGRVVGLGRAEVQRVRAPRAGRVGFGDEAGVDLRAPVAVAAEVVAEAGRLRVSVSAKG